MLEERAGGKGIPALFEPANFEQRKTQTSAKAQTQRPPSPAFWRTFVSEEEPTDVAQEQEMPLPQDLGVLLLLGIFGLLVFYTLYFTSEIAIPIVMAFILYLVLQPSMRLFAKIHVPRPIAALLIISVFFGGLTGLAVSLSGPTAVWIAKAPQSVARLEERLSSVTRITKMIQQAGKEVEKKMADDQAAPAVSLQGPPLTTSLFSSSRTMLVGVLTTVVLLFFLLVSGDLFLRRFVEIMPTLRNKKQAVQISNEIESSVSSYLLTITLMNGGVGLATGIAAYLCGLSDPILWGSVAFLLNYIPILGPLSGVAILFLAGLLSFDTIWQALLPAGLYLAFHLIEGEYVTPMLLARRFTLNPVLVIISLVFWYWMWGIAGAILAVPMLATLKIICDRIRPLMALGHFIGAEARS
jgi:predicted PurR-regulated permease PerM